MSILNDHRRYGSDEEREEWESEVKWEYRGEDKEAEDPYNVCENCKFYALDDERDENYCSNIESEIYGEYPPYKCSCEDWEGK